MSEIVIDICEHTDKRFFAAIEAARERGRVVSYNVERNLRKDYDRRFALRGYIGFGGTARIVVDVDDGVEEAPLFV